MSNGKEFTIVRDFDASPDLIWKAWTSADDVVAWWHPRNVSVDAASVTMDAREGGSYAYTMVRDADGEQFPNEGVFLELDEPRRLKFTWGNPGDADDDIAVITVLLEPFDAGTRMTFHLDGESGTPGGGGIHDGWDQAFDVLGELLARS